MKKAVVAIRYFVILIVLPQGPIFPATFRISKRLDYHIYQYGRRRTGCTQDIIGHGAAHI